MKFESLQNFRDVALAKLDKVFALHAEGWIF